MDRITEHFIDRSKESLFPTNTHNESTASSRMRVDPQRTE